MSRFISNKSCEMCRKIEVGLVEMKVGQTTHHLCYNCMTEFSFDVAEYAAHNLRNEFESKGYTIEHMNDGGVIIKAIPRASMAFTEGETVDGKPVEST